MLHLPNLDPLDTQTLARRPAARWCVWTLPLTFLLSFPVWVAPGQAQVDFRQILKTANQSRLQFSPYTVGSVISGAGDRLYILKAQKGQYFRITVDSTGARAFVAVFDPKGKELAILNESSQPFEYQLPADGDYYIFCYSGPTFHFYDLTVRVD